MADNLVLNAGSGGSTLATDDVGGVHYQRVKIADGSDGASTMLDVVAEDAAHVSGDTGLVMMTVRSNTAAALSGTDGDYQPAITDTNGRLHVLEPSAAGAATSLTTVAGAVSGTEMQVDVVAALPAGTNAIGKLAANSGVDIGDVDILSIAAGDNNIGNVDVLTVITGTGATNLGKAEDAAHTTGDTGVMALGVCNTPQLPLALSGTDGDYTPIGVDRYGAQFLGTHPNQWTSHTDGSTALTDFEVKAAPGVGLSIYITDITVSTGAATAMNFFLEEGSTKIFGPIYLEATAGRGFTHSFRQPKKITANTAVTITTSASIAQSVDIQGFIA